MSWPSLQSDHLEPFHTTLPLQCQQDIPSWDTRRFSCLVQRALLSASFIWNAKRGATGGSVSPRIKELLWRVPLSLLFCFRVCVCMWAQTDSRNSWSLSSTPDKFASSVSRLLFTDSNCSPFLFHLHPLSPPPPLVTLLKHSYCNMAGVPWWRPVLCFHSVPCVLSVTSLSPTPHPLDNRSHPAGSGSMGEVDAWPVYLSDSRQLHQRPICPHWHWHRHYRLWPVWMLCHLQRKPVDAEAGEKLQKEGWGAQCSESVVSAG